MSSVAKIRDAIKATVEHGVADEVFIYDEVPDVVNLPALIVKPDKCDFAGAMSRGLDTWEFSLYMLVARTDTETNQEQLDTFVTSGGPNSIRAALDDNPSLGLPDTDAFVRGVEGYGGEFETARVNHTGAILKVVVRTDGATQ